MLVKLRYIGTGEEGFTQGHEYVALSIDCPDNVRAVVLNDSGIPQKTSAISNVANWQVVSVDYVGDIRLYP